MNKNIIITYSCSDLFKCTELLIASIHKHSYDIIDEIIVLDLGLKVNEIEKLNHTLKVSVKDISMDVPNNYFNRDDPTYTTHEQLRIKNHGWGIYFLHHMSNTLLNCNIVYVSPEVCFINSIIEVLHIIELEDFFVTKLGCINSLYTGKTCSTFMQCTENELKSVMVQSELVGFKTGGKYQDLIDDWYTYCRIEECLISNHEQPHRYDQSILSILVNRYKVFIYDEPHFLYWYGGDDPNSVHYHIDHIYGTSYPLDCVSICHRGTYLYKYDELIGCIKNK